MADFPRPTLQELVSRIESDILSRVEEGTGILRRSILRVLARVFAGAVNLTFGFIDFLGGQLFIVTATNAWLERHATKWGKTRRQPTFAAGKCNVTGTDGKQIPANTQYQNADGIEYETKALVTIAGGVGVIEVDALASGVAGNQEEGDILTLTSPLEGIDDQAFVDADGIQGGEDLESDDDLRDRVLQRVQNPATGGNDADYIGWVLDTPGLGVTRVWIIGSFNGPGTVGIFFVLDNQSPIFPNPSNIATVQAVIDAHAPVGVEATVYAPVERKISITMDLNPNTAEVQNNVKDSLEAWFKDNTDVGMLLFRSQLDEAISLAAGEVDHTITDIEVDSVSVGVGDVQLGTNELPTIDPTDITFN